MDVVLKIFIYTKCLNVTAAYNLQNVTYTALRGSA